MVTGDHLVTKLLSAFQYIWSYFQAPEPKPTGYLHYLQLVQISLLFLVFSIICIYRWHMNSLRRKHRRCNERLNAAWQRYNALKAQEVICNLNFGGDKKTPIGKFASDVNVKYIETGIKTLLKCMEDEMKTASDLTAHIKPFLQEIGPLPEEMDIEDVQLLLKYFALYLQDKDKRATMPGADEEPYGYTEFSNKTVISSDDKESTGFEDLLNRTIIPKNDDQSTGFEELQNATLEESDWPCFDYEKSIGFQERLNRTIIPKDDDQSTGFEELQNETMGPSAREESGWPYFDYEESTDFEEHLDRAVIPKDDEDSTIFDLHGESVISQASEEPRRFDKLLDKVIANKVESNEPRRRRTKTQHKVT